jgi:hypothetical protein
MSTGIGQSISTIEIKTNGGYRRPNNRRGGSVRQHAKINEQIRKTMSADSIPIHIKRN